MCKIWVSKVYKKLNMTEVEEKQTLLPNYSRNDHKDQLPMDKKDLVIKVNDSLEKLLTESVAVAEFGSSGKTIKPSIYKIPKVMKDIQPKAFEPQLVSFGPYHHWDEHLFPMEQEKQKVFRHLVMGDASTNYQFIVSKVSDILEDLYAAYDNLDENWRKDAAKFMEMMIIDACFMLVFFSEDESYKLLITLKSVIKQDILMLENQLPFQLLELLYEILPRKDQNITLTSLINDLFERYEQATIEGKHILEMYRASLLIPPSISYSEGDKIKKNKDFKFVITSRIIPSATQLHNAGIKFQKSGNTSLENVSFKKDVLKLPFLIVDDYTETNLLNVMTFEKLHDNVGSQVSSFVVLMNNLIDLDEDVELLSNDRIIVNALGNYEDVVKLFSVLGNAAAPDLESNIAEIHCLLNKHFHKPWNRWCAHYKHTYFQSSWATISFLAANFGFAILIVQVVYQIVDFYTKKK